MFFQLSANITGQDAGYRKRLKNTKTTLDEHLTVTKNRHLEIQVDCKIK